MSDGIDALEQMVERLTAENTRLRAEVMKLEDTAKRIMRQDATFLTNERAEADRLRLDLARLTVDAAVECGRLRAERDEVVALLHGCAPEVKP